MCLPKATVHQNAQNYKRDSYSNEERQVIHKSKILCCIMCVDDSQIYQFNFDLFLLYPTVISGCFIQSLMKRQEAHSNLRTESIYEELLNIRGY